MSCILCFESLCEEVFKNCKNGFLMLLIIDNQSTFIKRFKISFLAEQDFEYMFVDHNEPIVVPRGKEIMGVIISGGKGNPWEPLNLTANFVALMNFDVPFIGFCLGQEIIAAAYRGRIKKLPEYQNKHERVFITKPDDPIFLGLNKKELVLVEKHNWYVSDLPPSFESLAYSRVCPNEIIKHKTRPIYGFMSHPEVSGDDGMVLINNWLRICGLL